MQERNCTEVTWFGVTPEKNIFGDNKGDKLTDLHDSC